MATVWQNVPFNEAGIHFPEMSFGLVGRIFTFIAERRAQVETMRELSRLDERDLHDLGINHYDFSDIASGKFRR